MTKKQIIDEAKRLNDILIKANVPQGKREALQPVIDNLALMRFKLDETRSEMMDQGVISHYDNGGNQKGEHENPLYKGYISLFKAYMQGLEKFTSYLPKEMPVEAQGEVINMLEVVKNMKKAK